MANECIPAHERDLAMGPSISISLIVESMLATPIPEKPRGASMWTSSQQGATSTMAAVVSRCENVHILEGRMVRCQCTGTLAILSLAAAGATQKQTLAVAKIDLGSCHDRPWQLPRHTLAAANAGPCCCKEHQSKTTTPKADLGGCQYRPWQLPRQTLAAASNMLPVKSWPQRTYSSFSQDPP